MSNKFRENRPVRTYDGPTKASHREYKEILEKDFNKRCGYTDCPQFWFGGRNNFHIDHFAPKSKFPELSTEYSNLVYCCSYVNRAKSNDWPSGSANAPIKNGVGYLDPCKDDYNKYFYRDNLGRIQPKPDKPEAQYMYLKLKLYLKRYSIIWMLEHIRIRIDAIDAALPDDKENVNQEILILRVELSEKFHEYLRHLEGEL